ncbi:MAG TPA: hypothetical protein VKT81_10795, partial [Bryobacteraceae bacterium]|nr:hypothetical protein [Bryobacteraceae bacterium]
LESGRVEDWNLPKLFAGAFLLTWASGLHYYAAAAFLGVSVYMVWALVSLGWKNGWPRVAALCAGGCLFGIPYMAFYLAPYFKKIWMAVQANQGNQGVMVALRTQFDWYRKWSQLDYIPALLRKPFGWGIPLLVYSTAILASIRSTRGLALAALPLQLFLFAFASHKLSSYFIHEVGIFAAAVAVGSIVLADYLLRRFKQTRLQNFLLPAAASLMVAYLIAANPALRGATVAEQASVHEADIARAASRSILGPHAKVAGRLGAWYSSGGEYWWDIESDMLRADPMNPATYFSNFDAVAEYTHMSDATQNSSISSWYANGTLKLRGFFFGETNEQLQIVLLTARSAPHVVGYAARNHQLFRFEEQADGDYETLSAVCPMTPELQQDHWGNRWDGTFSSMLRLPVRNSEPASVVLTVVAPRMLAEPAGWMARSCRSIGKVPGTLLLADRDWLIASLRRDDLPMKFPRDMESLPGYTGQGLNSAMTPPTESVRSNQFLSLAAIQPTTPQALVARVPQIRITTPAAGGSFAAQIPIAGRQSAPGPCWVQLRLRVLSGRIGFATYNIRDGILERTSAPVSKSVQPMDVVLPVPDLRKATSIVIFNDGDSSATVDVLDATVLTASSARHQ